MIEQVFILAVTLPSPTLKTDYNRRNMNKTEGHVCNDQNN